MQTLVERGCGDVHQATVVACLLMVRRDRKVQKQMRTFGTTTRELGAGQSYRRDLCRHIGYRPSSNRQPRMLVSQTDPFLGGLLAELYFHAWWCATAA